MSAWLSGDFSYVARSTWVPMDEIAPVMALAVIAAEDQKFPEHAGFDMAAIRAALAHNERDGARWLDAHAANGEKPVSVGWAKLVA